MKYSFEKKVIAITGSYGKSSTKEFIYELLSGKELLVFDPDTWRPYCHVIDFARYIAICLGLAKGLDLL